MNTEAIIQKMMERAKEFQYDVERMEEAGVDFNVKTSLADSPFVLLDFALDLMGVPQEEEGVYCRDGLHDIFFSDGIKAVMAAARSEALEAKRSPVLNGKERTEIEPG